MSMPRLVLDVSLFEPRRGDRLSWSERVILRLLNVAIEIDREYLADRPDTPLLYASGVRWKDEPPGRETFTDIPTVLERGHGDCAHLAAWRIAELRQAGVPCEPVIDRFERGARLLYHVRVLRLDNQTLEDPSAALGMPTSSREARAFAGQSW